MSASASRNRHARLQPGNAVIAEAGQDLVSRIEGQRDQQVEILVHDLKPSRHYADDLPRLGIDLDVSSDHRRVAAKTPLPVAVAQHRDLVAARDLVGRQDPSAGSWRNVQRLQHAVADVRCVHLFGLRDARDVSCT